MKIIFIIGNSRSGTTMLANILGKSPNALVFKELHFFDSLSTSDIVYYEPQDALNIYAKLLCTNILEPWNVHKYHQFLEQAKHEFKCDKKVTNYELFKTFLKNQLEKERKTVAIEQTPRNSFHFEKISSHIPESKIIHIYRDPRAVLVSQKNKWKRNRLGGNMTKREMMRTYFNHNPFVTSTIYNKTLTRIIDKSKSLGNKIFYQIKYEKLLVNSSDQIRHLFQFLGLEFDSEFLNINHNSSSFVKIEKKGIDKSRIDSWQLNINSAELFICQNINKKLIAKLEYPFIRKIPSPLRLISYLVILPFQIVLILLFNFRK